MPIYYFDVADADPASLGDGIELGSQADARAMALRYAGALLADKSPSFWLNGDMVLTVSDARRLSLFTITIFTSECAAVG